MKNEQQPITITLPRRGLRIFPPAETEEKIRQARNGARIEPFSAEEKYRLQRMINCSILAKRYQTREDGSRFMEEVDYQWQSELYRKAQWLTRNIVGEWGNVNNNEPIAVLIYGSVAKGLVKRQDHPDPSNIDIAVIGRIRPEERLELFDRIRPARTIVQEEILDHCLDMYSSETNPGNAGVAIQDLERLRNDGFNQTRIYITSGAQPLHDPTDLWGRIELESIRYDLAHNISVKRR